MAANDELADAVVAHAVDLQRLGASHQAEATKQLLALQEEVVAKIKAGQGTAFNQARLKALASQIEGTIRTGYDAVAKTHSANLLAAAKVEQDFAMASLDATIGGPVSTVAFTDKQLQGLVDGTLVNGRIVKDWWAKQADDLSTQVRGALTSGFASGEAVPKIADRVMAVAPLTRRQAEALVLTSLSHVTNAAKVGTYEANGDIIKAVQQLSTLDHRTTEICMARSGKQWSLPDYKPLGHSIPWNGGPPLHWRCRSTTTAVTKSWAELAGPNAKAAKAGVPPFDQAALVKRLKAKKLSPTQINAVLARAQASLDGQVARDLTYEQWLLAKEAKEPGWAVANGVLTKARYELWQDGKITLADLLDQSGNPLSIEALQAKVAGGKTEAALKGALDVVAQFEAAKRQLRDADKKARRTIRKAKLPADAKATAAAWVRQSREFDTPLGAPPDMAVGKINDELQEVALRRKQVDALRGPAAAAQPEVDAFALREARKTHTRMDDADGYVWFAPGGATEIAAPGKVAWSVAEPKDWAKLPDKPIAEPPPIIPPAGKEVSTGALIVEDDGRVWLFRPKGEFGGYKRSVPKGRVEPELSYQQNAAKEVFEETGLDIEVLDHLADQERTTTVTRYYLARRKGGSPWLMGDEADAVELVPLKQAIQSLGGDGNLLDQKLLWQAEAKLAAAGAQAGSVTDAIEAAAKAVLGDAAKTAQQSKTALFHAKNNLMQGKPLSAAQQAAVDGLDDAARADFMEVVETGKVKAAAHAEALALAKGDKTLQAALDEITGGKPFTIHSKGQLDPQLVLGKLQAQAPEAKAAQTVKALEAKGAWAKTASAYIDEANPGLPPSSKAVLLQKEVNAYEDWQGWAKGNPVAAKAADAFVPPMGPQAAVANQLKLEAVLKAVEADTELAEIAKKSGIAGILDDLGKAYPEATPAQLKALLDDEIKAHKLLMQKANADSLVFDVMAKMKGSGHLPSTKLTLIGDELAAYQKLTDIATNGSPATVDKVFLLMEQAADIAKADGQPWTQYSTALAKWQAEVAKAGKKAKADMMALVKDNEHLDLLPIKQAIEKNFPDLPAEEQLTKLQAQMLAAQTLEDMSFQGTADQVKAIAAVLDENAAWVKTNPPDKATQLLVMVQKKLGAGSDEQAEALGKLTKLQAENADAKELAGWFVKNEIDYPPKLKLQKIEEQLAAKAEALKMIDDADVPEDLWDDALASIGKASQHQKYTLALEDLKAQVDEFDAALLDDAFGDPAGELAEKAAAAALKEAVDNASLPQADILNAISQNMPGANARAKLAVYEAEIAASKAADEVITSGKIGPAGFMAILDEVPKAQQHMKWQLAIAEVKGATDAAPSAQQVAQAKQQLATWKAGGKGLKPYQAFLAKAEKQPGWAKLSAPEQVATVEAMQAEKLLQNKLYAAKQKLAAGKTVSAAEQEAIDGLDGAAHLQFLDDVEAYKAKLGIAPDTTKAVKAAEAVVAQADEAGEVIWADLVWDAPKPGGSQAGAIYRDTKTDVRWLVKQMPDDMSHNEVLASKLYALAGTDVVENRIVRGPNGETWLASRWRDGLTKMGAKGGNKAGVKENFVVDAWLGDWDVVGREYENIALANGAAVRVDVGGSLRYRAMGGLKTEFSHTVDEIESMLDPRRNDRTAPIFKGITQAQMLDGARRVVRITDGQIDEIVDSWGPPDAAIKTKLKAALKARRDDIARRFPEAAKDTSPAVRTRSTKGLLAPEQVELMKRRKALGVVRMTDRDMIEDNALKLVETPKTTDAWTRIVPTHPQAALLDAEVKGSGSQIVSFEALDDAILAAIKGTSSRAVVELKDIDRVVTARKAYTQARDRLIATKNLPAGALGQFDDRYGKWLAELDKRVGGGAGSQISRNEALGIFDVGALQFSTRADDTVKRTWRKSRKIEKRELVDGNFVPTTGSFQLNDLGEFYETTIDDVVVRYWPTDTAHAAGGRIHAFVKKPGAVDQIEKALGDLGLDLSLATDDAMRVRYAAQHFKVREIPMPARPAGATDAAYAKTLEAELSKAAGYDITRSPRYNPAGFDERAGFPTFMRADLDRVIDDAAIKELRFAHSVSGDAVDVFKAIVEEGGLMNAKANWIAQGRNPINSSGLSPGTDFRTGGLNYLYTSPTNRDIKDFVWDGSAGLRANMVVHRLDNYNTVMEKRTDRMPLRTSIKNILSAHEALFKNGLSFYEHNFRFRAGQRRDEVIGWLRSRRDLFPDGLWPDGRRFEEVVVAK